ALKSPRFGERLPTNATTHLHRRLLRARRERPSCRAAEQRDEFTPYHCLTPPMLPTERIAHLRRLETAAVPDFKSALGNSAGIGNARGIADEFAGLLFMAVAGGLVLQEPCEQLRHLLRLLLLHPMAGAVHQMKVHHAGARGLLHALGSARGLMDTPVALAP